MYSFKNKTVLVTGASMGIGASFAEALARQGAHLVLVARSEDKLDRLAETLRAAHGVRVDVIATDLARSEGPRVVFDAVRARGLGIDVLVNNAGFGAYGPFQTVALEVQLDEIALNVATLVELTHRFMPEIEARKGGVIQVASTAAFQPVPYLAVYAATKAFVLSFSEALWFEYRGRGVRVLALCPGATDTPFFSRAGEAAALGAKATPEDVVRVGLAAFHANRSHVVEDFGNTLNTLFARFASRALTAKISGMLMRPRKALGTGSASSA